MTTEKHLQEYLIKKARQLGLLSYKVVAVGRQGFPDVLIVDLEGQSHFIELKSPSGTGRLRPNQQRILKELEEHHANSYVFASKESVDAFLSGLETGTNRGD